MHKSEGLRWVRDTPGCTQSRPREPGRGPERTRHLGVTESEPVGTELPAASHGSDRAAVWTLAPASLRGTIFRFHFIDFLFHSDKEKASEASGSFLRTNTRAPSPDSVPFHETFVRSRIVLSALC